MRKRIAVIVAVSLIAGGTVAGWSWNDHAKPQPVAGLSDGGLL